MPSKRPDGQFIIAAGEIADFTVCPRAWLLKHKSEKRDQNQDPSFLSAAGVISHRFWAQRVDELLALAWRTKFVIGLTVVVLFVWEWSRKVTSGEEVLPALLTRVGSVAALLVCLLAVLVIMNTSLSRRRRAVGLRNETLVKSLDGSTTTGVKEFVSEKLLLAGRPDGIISEQGIEIPIEYKPHARKLRDRFIAQLLVYMRLLEEHTGKRPPYGYVVLGSNSRRVRVDNTPARQSWLDGELISMRMVLAEAEPAPARPHPKKCSRCSFKNQCPDAALVDDGAVSDTH